MEKLAEQADARFFLFSDDKVLITAGADARAAHERGVARDVDADLAGAVLLGFEDGAPRIAASGRLPEEAGALDVVDLRTLASEARVSAADLGALAQARSLLSWHQRHGFCANCGARSAPALGGYRRDCPSCGTHHFPRTDPVVIMLPIDGDRCVLGRQYRFQEGVYSCLAGFVEPGETLENAVRREIREEAGIEVGAVAYHASQPWPFPSNLMIGCFAEARSFDLVREVEELEDVRWFHRSDLPAMMARTHPDGFMVPPSMAIAYHLIKAFADGA
ncbi:NAD+ diphosphatase [Amorphus orientalis]|uniref:NAD(+) diphosphatase n=1 Tax=Amorphus orientalis TaxID=649198 RepID=A0AAE3VNH2_9HYPH|nr:NAD+ diphosphatase [Amorphus orientalis]